MSYADPVARETERLVRWLRTAGASPRLVTGVAAAAALRREIEGELANAAGLRLVPIDVSRGDLIPESFRLYRGTHTAFTLFVFHGLTSRLEASGKATLLELDREAGLFQRPATWAMLWLDDPMLPALIRRVAPRFAAAIELHPTFSDPSLFALPATTPSPTERLLETATSSGKRRSLAPEAAARTALERGDLKGAARLLDERAIDVEGFLHVSAEYALLAGDPQSALAHFAAAARTGGARRPLALVRAAEILHRLGENDGATALVAESSKGGDAESRARAALLGARLGMATTEVAVSGALAIAVAEPAVLAALARTPDLAPTHVLTFLRAAVAAAHDAFLREAVTVDLALELARGDAIARAESASLLAPLAGRDDVTGVRAQRGLASLARGAGDRERAARLLAGATAGASAQSLVLESIACRWESVAQAAEGEDLPKVLAALADLRLMARGAGLRPIELEALDQHARALRVARELALATGVIDELEALAKDMTWPDFELEAEVARGDHAADLGALGEAAAAYRRAAEIAEALGQSHQAVALRDRAVATARESAPRPSPPRP